jgi:hypothetical protein
MINEILNGKAKDLALIVAALAALHGCSKKNPVSYDDTPYCNQNAAISLRLNANQDSNYVKATVAADNACSVWVDVYNGLNVLAKDSGYINSNSLEKIFTFKNLPKPLDGSVKAYNNNKVWCYFVFPEVPKGVGGPNDSINPALIETEDTARGIDHIVTKSLPKDIDMPQPESSPIISDSSYSIPDTAISNHNPPYKDSIPKIDPAETTPLDSNDNNQSLF